MSSRAAELLSDEDVEAELPELELEFSDRLFLRE